jgi:hypothetical protein
MELGVEECGTNLWSMWKFWDRSAARLAVGEEPRSGAALVKEK